MQINLREMGKAAKQAARSIGLLSSEKKNQVLQSIILELKKLETDILEANKEDISRATSQGLTPVMLDRLTLSEPRLLGIREDIENVITITDPVGEILDKNALESGLIIQKKRTPLGVVGVIYEARPNVTIDVATLCLKTGNSVILRGGKETLLTNQVLLKAIQNALIQNDLPTSTIQLIPSQERKYVKELLKLDEYIDMIIPRGGAGLHQFCKEESLIPVITGGIGVCHLYADLDIDINKAIEVIHNAKVQRPTVCNALDTLIVHKDIASILLPPLAKALSKNHVEMRADLESHQYIENNNLLKEAKEKDFGTEFLSLILSVKTVNSLDEALDFIDIYSSGHSDGILTNNKAHAEKFLNSVDSAAVYHNASTRFTDGSQFGLGAEVAVSTQKLHARGPMALEGLTTYKWIICGDWHSRP